MFHSEEAAMLEPMSVACHALRRVKVSPDDTVAVCGLGTIGMFIVMLLLERNVKNLLVIGNKAFQRKKDFSGSWYQRRTIL
ncbi:MAG: hypothetical protein ACLU70_07430 [Lachnospira sp.]